MAVVEATGYSLATLLGASESLATGSAREALEGSGHSGPTGIESVFEYNGIFLNVREWIDTYLVTTIGGLDDADVRDSRELNPGYHGETPFPGFYGGRTITLTGKVYAHTLFKLRDMQQGLRQAFADLSQELPLVFRTPNPNLDMLIYCKKSQAIQMAEEQRTANHFERAFQIILRASNPRFLSVVKVHSSLNFSSLYDFTTVQFPVTKETFDDPNVLNLYNARGDGFKVQGGQLVSNGKANITNLILNPDFEAAVNTANIVATDCTLARSPAGGVDGGAYCTVNANSDRVSLEWRDFPVKDETFYSASVWVRATLGSKISFDVEWRIDATNYWSSRATTGDVVATGGWQQIKVESMYAPDTTTMARWRVVVYDTYPGAALGVDKAMFVNGSTFPLGGYFDGTYPLAKWDGNGAAYVNTSTRYPYTILTTGRSYTKPMMTVKPSLAAIDATHPWSGQDIRPEGFRIVLAYIDDGNQIYVTFKDRPASNLSDAILVVWRNGERERYSVGGLTTMSFTNANLTGNVWFRALMKNGDVVFEKWKVDPALGQTDANKEWEYWHLTPEQSSMFERGLPMQFIALDQQYVDTGVTRQDTWRFDEVTFQSIDDLSGWEFMASSAGILNATPATYEKSGVYVKSNRLYELWNANAFLLRKDLPYQVGNGAISYKIRYDDPIGTLGIDCGIIGKYIDSNHFVYAGLSISSATNMTITVATPSGSPTTGGIFAYLDFPKTDFPEDTDRWLRLVMNGNTFTVEFWTTDPALGGVAARTRSGTVAGDMINKLGVGTKGRVGLVNSSLIPSAYIDDYVVAQTNFDDTALLVTNNGNFRAQPVIELAGPLTNVVLTNEANNEWMSLVAGTTIPDGERWVIDIAERRMYRQSDQANRFKYLDANSDWMELEPGENPISMAATGTAVASQVSIDFNHTVM